ncbi:MAG: hypothetical protein IPL08_01235 [Saprospiraceae bacterium]|nr:hypothetical protein [Saprospiraceae bacterium]
MKLVFSIGLTICISVVCLGQKGAKSLCTGQLTKDPIIETIEKTHYIFTGSDTTGLNVKVTKIKVVEARKELVKRRKDKNCQSPNPEDCLVEVMEEIPAVTMNLYTLSGPDQTSEYDTRTEKVQVTKDAGGIQTINIVCPKNRTEKLVKKVQSALLALGYPMTINGIMDQATLLSIKDFQQSKKMAYGDLSLETLAALGIK